jgi:diguanylate cyclase (GGDEF)-like protein
VTLMQFDLDSWTEYQEIFGRGPGENVVRQVGRTIAAVARRASDVVAKSSTGGFTVLGVAMEADHAFGFAEQILARVRALSIHHPRSSAGRFLTLSAGVVTAAPPRTLGHDAIVEASVRALESAKSLGGNRAVRGEL